MKRFFACVASFLLPGLGQLFYGRYGWALLFFIGSCLLGPFGPFIAAGHVLFIQD